MAYYHYMSEKDWPKVEQTTNTKIRKAEFLAAGKACKDIFWPTTGLKEGAFDNSRYSIEGIFISDSEIPQYVIPKTETNRATRTTENTTTLKQHEMPEKPNKQHQQQSTTKDKPHKKWPPKTQDHLTRICNNLQDIAITVDVDRKIHHVCNNQNKTNKQSQTTHHHFWQMQVNTGYYHYAKSEWSPLNSTPPHTHSQSHPTH